MPNVVVYVPAAKWRELGMAGIDPATHVRDIVRRELERGVGGSQPLSGSLPAPLSVSRKKQRVPDHDPHFKPDFKAIK